MLASTASPSAWRADATKQSGVGGMSVLVLGSVEDRDTCIEVAERTKAGDVTVASYTDNWSAAGHQVVVLVYPSQEPQSLDIVREARACVPVIVVERAHEQLASMYLANAVEEVVFDTELGLLARAVSRAAVRRETSAHLERMARVDPLTELLNRRGISELIPRICRRTTQSTAVLVDVDDFKGVNTRLGHAGGDMVLRQLADTIRELVRPTDVAARTGGDEFVIVLPSTGPAEAVRVVERIRAALFSKGISASFGLADAAGASTLDELVLRTQSCLVEGKARGKNCLVRRGANGELVTLAPTVHAP